MNFRVEIVDEMPYNVENGGDTMSIVKFYRGDPNAPKTTMPAHLGANVILLEGIRLDEVSEGVYFLNAAPLNLSGADGSPCRAVLIDTNDN